MMPVIETDTLTREEYDGRVGEALLAATQSFSGAWERWEARRLTGLSDDELTGALIFEFGIQGGSSLSDGWYQQHFGNKTPRLQVDPPSAFQTPPIVLKGDELLTQARRVLGIRRPAPPAQLQLFA